MRFFVKRLGLCLLISGIITACIDILSRQIFSRKQTKLKQKIKEKEDAENMFLSLAMDKNPLCIFKQIFGEPSVEKKTYLVFEKEGEKNVVFPQTSLSPLTINDIAYLMKKVKQEKAKKVIIVTGEISKDCFNFIKIFDEKIILLDKYQTYASLYKPSGIYPAVFPKVKQTKKATIKELFTYSFSPERAKGYFFSALVLVVSSLFVRANLYYSIMISILLVFAIISLSNPFKIKKPSEKIL